MNREFNSEEAGSRDRRFIIKYFLDRCGPAPRVLEIGVDTGDVFAYLHGFLAERGGSYTGIDINLSKARESGNLQEVDSLSSFVEKPSSGFWRFDAQGLLWDLIYIDGNHSDEPAFFDVWHGLHHLSKDGWLLIHDVHHPPEAGPYYAYRRMCEEDPRLFCEILPKHLEGMAICYWREK